MGKNAHHVVQSAWKIACALELKGEGSFVGNTNCYLAYPGPIIRAIAGGQKMLAHCFVSPKFSATQLKRLLRPWLSESRASEAQAI